MHIDDFRPRQSNALGMIGRAAVGAIQPRPEQLDTSTNLAERNLYEFVKQAWHVVEPSHSFVEGWHIGCVCAHLEALSNLQIRNLLICMPPRHCKSLAACVFWFCWSWVRNPAARFMYGSYGQNLVQRDAQYCLDIFDSPWFRNRWDHLFRLRRRGLDKLTNSQQGYRIAATVGGKILGEGAEYLVWDDPLKPQDALSAAMRSSVIRTWTGAMSTRGNDPATTRRLVIQQRLHERDLPGYLMAERDNYEALILPAEYEPARYFLPLGTPVPLGDDGADAIVDIANRKPASGDSFESPDAGSAKPKIRDQIKPTSVQRANPEWMDPRTEPGDLLWPQRFNAAAIEDLKTELEAVGWAGQGQQRPAPAEGSIYKAEFFRHFTVESDVMGNLSVVLRPPDWPDDREPLRLAVDDMRFFQCVDTALTDKPKSDFTAIGTFAWHRPTRNLLVWDVWKGKLEVHEQMEALGQMREGHAQFSFVNRTWTVPGRIKPWPRPIMYQGVENKASGIGFLQQARLEGQPLVELKGDKNPIVRAAAAVTMMRNGKIWFMASAKYLVDFVDELLAFPRGAHDDCATVLAYAAQQAGNDALLNADIEGDLIAWPPAPNTATGIEETTDPAIWEGDKEIFHIADTEVVFDDSKRWWEPDAD
jgi:predicted phage terminase large subunit-like protein